jgi:hypothetical protein
VPIKRRVSLPVLSLSDQRLSAKTSSEGWRLCLRPNKEFSLYGPWGTGHYPARPGFSSFLLLLSFEPNLYLFIGLC